MRNARESGFGSSLEPGMERRYCVGLPFLGTGDALARSEATLAGVCRVLGVLAATTTWGPFCFLCLLWDKACEAVVSMKLLSTNLLPFIGSCYGRVRLELLVLLVILFLFSLKTSTLVSGTGM